MRTLPTQRIHPVQTVFWERLDLAFPMHNIWKKKELEKRSSEFTRHFHDELAPNKPTIHHFDFELEAEWRREDSE